MLQENDDVNEENAQNCPIFPSKGLVIGAEWLLYNHIISTRASFLVSCLFFHMVLHGAFPKTSAVSFMYLWLLKLLLFANQNPLLLNMKGFDDQVLTGRILVVWNEWCTEVTVRIWKVIYSFLLLATDVGNWPLQFYWCCACVSMLEIDSIPAPFSLVKVDHRSGDRKPEAEHHHISKAKPFKKEGLFNINKAILFGMLMPLCIPLWASTSLGFWRTVTAQLILSNVQRTCLCFPV